jgi:hypothetical protein
MSNEGRPVVKSRANGYAGGCHPIRIVISNTAVDRQWKWSRTLLVAYLVRRGPIPGMSELFLVSNISVQAVGPNQLPLCTDGF